MRQDFGDMAAVDPAGLRWRRGKADEIDEFDSGTAAIQHTYEIRQRMAAVVATHGGEGLSPVVELRIERGEMGGEGERPGGGQIGVATPAGRGGGR